MRIAVNNSGKYISITLDEFATCAPQEGQGPRPAAWAQRDLDLSCSSSVLPRYPAHGKLAFDERSIDSSHDSVLLIKLPDQLPPPTFKGGYKREQGVTYTRRMHEPLRNQLRFRLLGLVITITWRAR